MRKRSFLAPAFLLLTAIPITGCGSAEQKYDAPKEIAHVTPSQRAKGWLDAVAESGQLDSGISMLPETFDEMQAQDGVNVDELKKDAERLAQLRNSAEIKKLAQAMSDKIEAKIIPPTPVK